MDNADCISNSILLLKEKESHKKFVVTNRLDMSLNKSSSSISSSSSSSSSSSPPPIPPASAGNSAVGESSTAIPGQSSGIDTWTQCCGYLEKKSRNLKTFKSRYFVLESNILHRYTDSDRYAHLEAMEITSGTVIEALPTEGDRRYIFAVVNGSNKCILSAGNAQIMEMWMIALIQSSMGSFESSERFSLANALPGTYERRAAELTPSTDEDSLEVNSSEKFYVNDSTLYGRLRKANIANPSVHFKVNNFYMQYFSYPCEYPGFMLIRVCENQRYFPFKGWNCLHLLPTDPAKLSSPSGEKFPYRYLRATDPPLGYHWPVVPPTGNTGWCVEDEAHDSGWRYATSFSKFTISNSSGYTDFTSFSKSSSRVVRRRIWRRYAQLTADPVSDPLPRDGSEVEAISLLDSGFCVTTIEQDELTANQDEYFSGSAIVATEVGDGSSSPSSLAASSSNPRSTGPK